VRILAVGSLVMVVVGIEKWFVRKRALTNLYRA